MKRGKGIENPAFLSSPDTPRRFSVSPSHVEVSVLSANSQAENSQPLEPPEPQKSREPPLPTATPPDSQERSGAESLSEFEGPCGWGNFQPQCFQLCNTPQGFLLHYCLLALTQGIVVNGLVNISISTIEKRYEMKSSLTGLISSSYDIAFCLLSLFVSYIGERGHKPRWLAFASFMIGLGALVFSLPKFFSGKYQLGSPFEDTCLIARNRTSCTSSSSSLSSFLYVFILGQLLLGTGGTPLYTLGTAFIDDSVPTHKSSLYIGIGYSMSILGPAIGYVLGGQLLTMYIDVGLGQSTDIDEDDPRWLGAWWIGFLLAWLFAWCLIIPFSCFPKHLPGTAKIQGGKTSQTHQSNSSLEHTDENFGKSFKDFPAALKNLMKNTVFMCLVISTSSEALVTTGFATFLPKFIENQFGLSSSFAATLGGAILIPGAALGQIIGGVLVSKFKMTCKNTMKFALLTSFIALVLSFVFIYASCENEPFAGVSELYNGTGNLGNLTHPCNANCNCMRSHYYPVCGRDGVQYFSPCFAGCKSSVSKRHPEVYYNCSCIEMKAERVPPAASLSFEAKAGKCETRCTNLPIFLGIFFAAVVFTFMAGTPVTVSILRCVNQRQRSLALGIQFMMLRLLGSIPGPIIFGVTIDSTCVLWDINECGIKGACWNYDNIRMAYMLVAISVICKVITLSFNGLAVFLYKPPPLDTDVSFQNLNAVLMTVPVERDLNKAGTER
ncbi:solute carrier organic anion transporter family member 4C1 isoform X1 [Molossus molossus]|uniref:Solute carrier organic anion transporter family member n=2 Tax=Molossus molossus TaxID=27622 RepID=A0A7J8J3U4_MOLMO|nr:solute carrier organic anion transporter family member 4C1 isoform X1 [Molossus molossus]KAF6491025.1 solute carrier organic anion transporter family member 4C1 [Molossus molossus]